MTDSQPATKEGVRTRETLKYAGPLVANSRRIDPSRPIEPKDLIPSPDASLTAFAQLGCFRLGASRAFISLFDRHDQHVIAEATQAQALDPTQVDVHQLWLCGTSRPRVTKCPDEIVLASKQTTRHEMTPEEEATPLPIVVVPDMRKDDRFLGGFAYEQWPDHSFYAGIPLRAKNGINIGVYSVLDNKPRNVLNKNSQEFLRDMARIIMQYLESRAAKDQVQRGERMIRGLGSFVEGKSTLMSSTNAFEDVPGQQEGNLNEKQQDLTIDHMKNTYPEIVGLQREQDIADASSPGTGNQHESGSSQLPMRPALSKTMSSTSATRTGTITTSTVSDEQPEANGSPANRHASITATDPFQSVVKEAFSRASNVIRECIEVEGAMFLEVNSGTLKGPVFGHGPKESSDSEESPSGTPSSNESQPRSTSPPSGDEQPRICDVLGFSTGHSSSIDRATSSIERIPQRLLSALLRRFPSGKIFNFDLDGSLLTSDSDLEIPVVSPSSRQGSPQRQAPNAVSAEKRRRKEGSQYHSLSNQAKAISSLFPGARSVAVVPLWDSVRDRWFSVGVFWTQSPTRIFTVEGELSYLRAFGTTLMGEVARLNALASDKSKSDFLSSLSHELRSPLHGVIAAVDLLNDTNIDPFQGDTVHLIETSGRTLLDTLDHLLDHSKVNTYISASKLTKRQPGARSRGAHGLRSQEMGMMAKESDASLDVLVEEVVESVFAGYNFQVMSIARANRNNQRQADDEAIGRLDTVAAVEAFGHDSVKSGITQKSKRDGVLVYLDIDPTVSWQFRAQPGAVRRVVMNLLGNSLKFTTSGYIWISLRQIELPGRKGKLRTKVVLMVSDSGKGIGDQYLRNDLFSPFKQEDPLAPGTGLGLSLVRQISSTMDGSVTVTSQLGRGTTVRVTLPLTRPIQAVEDDGGHRGFLEQLRGLSLCLRGFTRFHDRVLEEKPEQPSRVSEAAVMETLCSEWLGLQVIPAAAVEHEKPDLFLYNEAAFTNLDSRALSERLGIPAVVICRDALTAHMFAKSAEKSKITEFISQPVGPRRLARSLVLAVIKWEESIRPRASRVWQRSSPSTTSSRTRDRELEKQPRQAGDTQENGHSPEAVGEDKMPIPASNDKPNDTPEKPTSPNLETISKDSQNVSQGAGAQPRHCPSAKDGTATSASPNKRKYLLVDDNDINLRILASFMKKLGIEYETAVNGLQAVEKYATSSELYQCILMDISMPVLDGVQATRRIREHEQVNRLSPTTIIALTGLGSEIIRQDAEKAGVDVFLTKPVNLKSLREVLDEYMIGGT